MSPIKKHLFLQGNIAIGKSTLIRKSLLPHLRDVGGFYVQRIYLDNEHVGFQLKPLSNNKTYQLNKYVHHLENKENLFIYRNENKTMQIQLNIFENEGVSYLQKSREKMKKIVLMDEIGGVDLYCPTFIQSVIQILNGPQSVIGVLKLSSNRKRLSNKLAEPEKKEKEIQETLSIIKDHPLVHIIELRQENYTEVQTKVETFVRNALQIPG